MSAREQKSVTSLSDELLEGFSRRPENTWENFRITGAFILFCKTARFTDQIVF